LGGALPTLTARSLETHRETKAFVRERWQGALTPPAHDGFETRLGRDACAAEPRLHSHITDALFEVAGMSPAVGSLKKVGR
jgi:hypothetical protein